MYLIEILTSNIDYYVLEGSTRKILVNVNRSKLPDAGNGRKQPKIASQGYGVQNGDIHATLASNAQYIMPNVELSARNVGIKFQCFI